MTTLWNAYSVDPATATDADIAAILTQHDINTSRPVPGDFFQAGATYQRGRDTFPCVAVGWLPTGNPVALGYLPIVTNAGPSWEVAFCTAWDWRRGWTKVEA